ncbi:MAG: transcriptional repressor [Firmicutes bacterium]|nr:transcriptional repressor [Bacillota bacterium]
MKEKEAEVLENYLREKNLKITGQRKLILDAFLNNEEHISAEELYDRLKKDYPRIGLATIYRTLKLLSECGLANEIHFSEGVTRYEHLFGHEHHDHLICLNCGKYIEVLDPEIEELQSRLAQKNNFQILRHRMEIYGICRECSEK